MLTGTAESGDTEGAARKDHVVELQRALALEGHFVALRSRDDGRRKMITLQQ